VRWGVIVAAVICLALRKPQGVTNPQIWAEDGSVFFGQAYLDGVASLGERYAGYFHTIPRVIALLAEEFVPSTAPWVFSASWIVGLVWVALFATSPRVALPGAIFIPLILLLAPIDGEPFFNVTNLQWLLAWILVLIAVARTPTSFVGKLHDTVAVLSIGLSGLFSVFFFPLFLLKAVWERSAHAIYLLVLTAVCAVIQVVGFDTVQRAPPVAEPIYSDYWRVLGRPLFGWLYGPVTPLAAELAWLQSALGGLTLLLLFIGAAWSLRKRNFPALGFFTAATLMWIAVGISISGNPSILLAGGARYFFLQPTLMVAGLLTCGLLPKRVNAGVSILLVGVVALHLEDYADPKVRDVRWARQLQCLSKPLKVAPDGSPIVKICRIRLQPPGWYVELPPRAAIGAVSQGAVSILGR
jgi:hypothetical protein